MASLRSSAFGVGLLLLAAAACGGNSGTDTNAGKAGTAGAETAGERTTSTAGIGGAGGGTANGGGAANGGGTTSKAGSVSSGGEHSSAGSAGTASAGATAGGAQSTDATACNTIDDCVIATVFATTGCCARTDCGSALNRDWVLNEPCASADASKDPVPQSCSKGCNACPASQCTEPVGVACNSGKCQTISMEGPCATDADCVLAIDYTTVLGACCSCTSVVSKAFEAAESCVEPEGAAKPANCTPPSGDCTAIDCRPCTKSKPTCEMGRCVPR